MTERLLTDDDIAHHVIITEGRIWHPAAAAESACEEEHAKTAAAVYKEVGEWLKENLIIASRATSPLAKGIERLLAGLPPEQEGREE